MNIFGDCGISMKKIIKLIEHAKKLKWCIDPQCTTCGSLPFKKELKKIDIFEIVEELLLIPQEFIDTSDNRDALIIVLMYIGVFAKGARLDNTPIGKLRDLELN
jgi:hypothetical protein